MNANQIVNMISRMIIRRLVNGGMNAGINAMAKRKTTSNVTSDEADGSRNQRPPNHKGAKHAKQAMRVLRRTTRF